MKISDKFPEINHFIEKSKDYELLYYQGDKIHNEYPLEAREAKAIFNYIDYLENKCKKQKEIIDEAIEYIKNNVYEEDNGCGNYWWEIADKDELLKILENKEVSE